MALPAGARLGPYEILAPLGAGGMGEVYRAKDPRLGRDVAIKVLPSSLCADPDRLRRFEHEARAAGLLNHPNVTAVHDVGFHEGAPYVVQEILEGETLRSVLARGALSQRRAVDHALQIVQGLAAAHQKGIVHRDLKPENLMVTREGGVKILDFGLAKLIPPESTPGSLTSLPTTTSPTIPGLIMGTFKYMSPEQSRGSSVDHRSDIFAFGVVLYEMLVGHRPFDRETPAETTTAILREEPPAGELSASGVSPPLERIVLHCLEKEPTNRFQSASDLAFALRGLGSPAEDSGKRVTSGGVRSGITRSVLPLADGTRLAGAASPALAISRDGSKLAYVAIPEEGPPSLYVAHLDRGETERIPESEQAVGPFFSPNGLWVGFAAHAFPGSRRPGELRKHSFSSGLTQTVCALSDFEGGCWGDDGTIYFVGSSVEGLRRVPVGGGSDEPAVSEFRVGSIVGPRCIGYPRLLPGERSAVVVDWDGSALGDTSVLDLATGELRSFASSGSAGTVVPTGHLVHTKADGTLLAAPWDALRGRLAAPSIAVAKNVALDSAGGIFAVSDTGTLVFARGQVQGSVFEPKRLLWLERGGVARPLGFPSDSISSAPTLSADGRYLAVTTRIPGLWICDLERGTRARLPPGNTRLSRFPLWSRDDESVLFRGAAVGEMGWKVFRQRVDGSSEPEVVVGEDAREKRPRGFTADGSAVLCEVAGSEAEEGLWAYSMSGREAPGRLISGPLSESALSRDGHWLAYESGELGLVEIFARRLDGRGGGRQVSIGGGRSPRWSHDGRKLFYCCENRLFEAPFEPHQTRPEFGPARLLFERPGIEGYEVAPDGAGLIAVERLPGSGIVRQLQLVTGWFSELTRLAPV